MQDLLRKYDTRGPRYTSYPPVPFWNGDCDSHKWLDSFKAHYSEEQGVDIYIHIPFCEKLCWYCGCHRIISKSKKEEANYVDLLIKEWKLYLNKLGDIKVHSLHLGGGTPTWLSAKELDRLLNSILIKTHKDFIGSVEVDPRTCKDEHLKVLAANGFKRLSMGVQDFDEKVQKSINRIQPFSLVHSLTSRARQLGFNSINFDLIYGLPNQSVETIEMTVNKVISLEPDMIAYYSYAHLPNILKNQKLIKEEELPNSEVKFSLYQKIRSSFLENDWAEIGLDHFAAPTSVLSYASKLKKLKRNFMGYTDKKSPLVIGLGTSSIGNGPMGHIQNIKDLKDYRETVNRGQFPFSNGHSHSDEDIIIDELIQTIMCDNEWEHLDNSEVMNSLLEMQDDGLLEINGSYIRVLPPGRPFLRNMAMLYDHHLHKSSKGRFSKTV